MNGALAWVFILFCAWLYFLPALTAWVRHHHNTLAIFALDLLLGWTMIGWAIAMVWACMRVEARMSVRQ